MGDDIARNIYCDITMSDDLAIYIYRSSYSLPNDVAVSLFYDVLLLPIINIVGSLINSLKLYIKFEISLHKNNSHDLHRMITHSLVLVIRIWRSYLNPLIYTACMVLMEAGENAKVVIILIFTHTDMAFWGGLVGFQTRLLELFGG